LTACVTRIIGFEKLNFSVPDSESLRAALETSPLDRARNAGKSLCKNFQAVRSFQRLSTAQLPSQPL